MGRIQHTFPVKNRDEALFGRGTLLDIGIRNSEGESVIDKPVIFPLRHFSAKKRIVFQVGKRSILAEETEPYGAAVRSMQKGNDLFGFFYMSGKKQNADQDTALHKPVFRMNLRTLAEHLAKRALGGNRVIFCVRIP
jgi:hypothetical protein